MNRTPTITEPRLESTASAEPTSIALRVANMDPADAKFIRNVVALFCDPQYATHADQLRNGKSCVTYEPGGALQSRLLLNGANN